MSATPSEAVVEIEKKLELDSSKGSDSPKSGDPESKQRAEAPKIEELDRKQSLDSSKAGQFDKKQRADVPESPLPASDYQLFISAAQKNPEYDTPMTGDIDYTQSIVDQLNIIEPCSAELIKKLYKEEEIYKHVLSQPNPLLHIMLNPPFTGMAFTPEGIKEFREKGGKVIVTVIEFAKFEGRDKEYQEKYEVHPQKLILQFLQQADGAVFLDENDRKTAAEFFYSSGLDNLHIEEILTSAKVIPVLPTITPMTKPLPERGKDIISFGIIRPGKGLGLVIELAEVIKSRSINKKVLVVGTVLGNEEGLSQLQRLMAAVYPSKNKEIFEITSVPILIETLQVYKATLEPALPLEIHTNVPKKDLPALFDRCAYAFLPAYRGGTFRNSSISSCVAQRFIVYTHSGSITPSELLVDGIYQGAVVIKEFNEKSTKQGGNGKQYVLSVLEDILKRDQNPQLNVPNLEAMEKLLQKCLNREIIARQHLDLYSSVVSASAVSSALVPSSQPPKKGLKAAHHWRGRMCATRAYTQFREAHGIDISLQAKENFSALIGRLGKLEKEEIRFLTNVLKEPWFLSHTTDFYPEIRKGGNTLLSLMERIRRSPDKIKNRHTSHFEGNDDNVFFTFGPGDISSPDFLENAEHVIKINFEKALENRGLTGLWFSNHVYAFRTEQNCQPMIIHGAKFSICYRKIDPKKPIVNENLHKIIRFEYQNFSGDPVEKCISVKIKDEIFLAKHMKAALALMAIEKFRDLGKPAWEAIMQEQQLEYQQQIIQDMFHTGLYEAHKPAFLSLDKDYITVEKRKKKPRIQPSASVDTQALSNLIAAIFKKEDSAYELVEKDPSLLIPSSRIGFKKLSLDPLSAATATKNKKFVKQLLDSGNLVTLKILGPASFSTHQQVGEKWVYNTPITGVLLLASPDIKEWLDRPELEQDIKSFREYLSLFTHYGSSVPNRPHLRYPHVISEDDIQNAIIFGLPSSEVCYLVSLARDIHPNHLPIVLAVSTGNAELLQLMLKMGANVNQQDTEQGRSTGNKQLIGFTPLLKAIFMEDEGMVDLLLVQDDIDVNKPWKTQSSARGISLPLEGYTPLMLAAEQGLTSILDKLLAKKAKITCLNLKGESALTIAKSKASTQAEKFSGILKTLEENSLRASDLKKLSELEKLAFTKQKRFIRIGLVLCGKDEGNRSKILTIDGSAIFEEMTSHLPFDPLQHEMVESLMEETQIKPINQGKLLELSLKLSEDDTFYGLQLFFVEFSSKDIKLIQDKMKGGLIEVRDLRALRADDGQISVLEKTTLKHLKIGEKGINPPLISDAGKIENAKDIKTLKEGKAYEEDREFKKRKEIAEQSGSIEGEERFYIADPTEMESAWGSYLAATVNFRAAIESRDLKGVQEFLDSYPDAYVDEVLLHGECPNYPENSSHFAKPTAINLAYALEFTECLLVFFKLKRIKELEDCSYKIFKAAIIQDDFETFLDLLDDRNVKGYLEHSSSFSLSELLGKQFVLTGKIADWFLKNKKELCEVEQIVSKSFSTLSARSVNYWTKQLKELPKAEKYYDYFIEIMTALNTTKKDLTIEQQAEILQLLINCISKLDEFNANYISSYLKPEKLKRLPGEFLEKIYMSIGQALQYPEARRLFVCLTLGGIISAGDFNKEQRINFYKIVAQLLTIEVPGNPFLIESTIRAKSVELFSMLLQKDNFDDYFLRSEPLHRSESVIAGVINGLKAYTNDDIPVLQKMLKVLVITASKPGDSIANKIINKIKEIEGGVGPLSKVLIEIFDKLKKEKESCQEGVIGVKEIKASAERKMSIEERFQSVMLKFEHPSFLSSSSSSPEIGTVLRFANLPPGTQVKRTALEEETLASITDEHHPSLLLVGEFRSAPINFRALEVSSKIIALELSEDLDSLTPIFSIAKSRHKM